MHLRPMNYYKSKYGYWFTDMFVNGIFFVEEGSKTAKYICEFPTEKNSRVCLFQDSFMHNGQIFFIPSNGKDIWNYNIDEDILSRIDVKNYCGDKYSSSVLYGSIILNNNLYALQACTSSILKLDLKTKKIKIIDLIPLIQLNSYGYVWSFRSVLYGKTIVLYNLTDSCFYVIDCEKESIVNKIFFESFNDFVIINNSIVCINVNGDIFRIDDYSRPQKVLHVKSGRYYFHSDTKSIVLYDSINKKFVYEIKNNRLVEINNETIIDGYFYPQNNELFICDKSKKLRRGVQAVLEDICFINKGGIKLKLEKDVYFNESKSYSLNNFVEIIEIM